MAFEKGQSGNPAGKKPGTKNKVNEELREMITEFLNTKGIPQLIEDFDNMKHSYRWKVITELLPYATPRLSAAKNDHKFEDMTEEQLDKIIAGLTNKPTDED